MAWVAVGFDDELRPRAVVVEDVRAERHLPAELEPGEPAVAEHLPQRLLGRGRLLPHRPGEVPQGRVVVFHDDVSGKDGSSHGQTPCSGKALQGSATPSPRQPTNCSRNLRLWRSARWRSAIDPSYARSSTSMHTGPE